MDDVFFACGGWVFLLGVFENFGLKTWCFAGESWCFVWLEMVR